MCGIVGIIDPRASRGRVEMDALLDRMTDQMAARGPDGSGTWIDEHCGVGFGHRRLSIVDLSAYGAQPMQSSDGRYVITFNGEIYGHQRLAVELRDLGSELRGHSDTEVLVEAVARWGVLATLDRVDGMFAFAIWDRAQRKLTLARDRLGEKPLCYGVLDGQFVFASTLDALRAHPGFDRPVDRSALALYFRYKYVPAPWTVFEGIRKLEPGCFLEVDADGQVGEPRPYWSLFDIIGNPLPFTGSAQDAVDELDRLLCESVRDRLIADVPVGAFLSGGIDSSAVVAAAQRVSTTPVRTFTIGSRSSDYDESADAQRVAACLGTEHTELVVTDADALAVIERIGSVWDEPFGDSSQVPTLLVSELARRDVAVALSGDGGDELFLGYNRYSWVPRIWSTIARVPSRARGVVAPVGRRIPPGWWDRAGGVVPRSRRPRMFGLKATKVLGVLDASSSEDVFHRLCSHWTEVEELVPGAKEPSTVHDDPRRWPPTASIVEHMAAVDAVTYLPDDILTKVDRATMSVSLEGRVPLLSRDIVEFAVSLPVDLRMRDGMPKWLLRQVLSRSVPTDAFERPKSGFGVPIEDWLSGPLRSWAEEHLHGEAVRSYLEPTMVEAAWQEHLDGRRNTSYELWDVLMFSVWCEARRLA